MYNRRYLSLTALLFGFYFYRSTAIDVMNDARKINVKRPVPAFFKSDYTNGKRQEACVCIQYATLRLLLGGQIFLYIRDEHDQYKKGLQL